MEEIEELPPEKKKCCPRKCCNVPISVFFILGNEFCERFMYYGMRAVLTLYLREELKMSEIDAKRIYHTFVMLNYFLPVPGAIMADAFAGKYWTIFLLSIVYVLGAVLMAATSPPNLNLPRVALVCVSLVVIALGSGGIKPCVSAFAGDQFPPEKTKARDRFYYAFYFAINFGAMLSMMLTPRLRADVTCIPGYENCYPLAFGVPSILMAIALVLFIAGTPLYIRHSSLGSTFIRLIKCCWYAFVKLLKRRSGEKREHWVDYADDKYDEKTISELKAVLHVSFVFTSLPVFWSLFEQQGSLWTLQSAKLDGETVFGQILPDQMDTMNTIFVLLFIPLFTVVLYPLCERRKLLRSPLQRIGVGMLLAGVSFVIGGFLNLAIEDGFPANPPTNMTEIVFHNAAPCELVVTFGDKEFVFERDKSEEMKNLDAKQRKLIVKVDKNRCPEMANVTDLEKEIILERGLAYSVLLALSQNGTIDVQQARQDREREWVQNRPKVRFIYVGSKMAEKKKLIVVSDSLKVCPLVPDKLEDEYAVLNKENQESTVCFTKHEIEDRSQDECRKYECDENARKQVYKFRRGGIYDALITDKEGDFMNVFITAQPDSVPILLQVPQYVLITAGEVMASITALSFAYAESPESTKSVMQAIELVTIAVGSFIILVVDTVLSTVFKDKLATSMIFFAYALIMMLDVMYFLFIAKRYEYVNPMYQLDDKSTNKT